MVLVESFGTVSYSHSIVTMALSCIIFEIKRDIGRKSRFFFIFHLNSTLMLGDPRRNSAICFDTEKSRMMWLQDAEKSLRTC